MLSRTVIVVLSLVLAATAKPPRNTRDYDYGELATSTFNYLGAFDDIIYYVPAILFTNVIFKSNSKSQKAAGYSMAEVFLDGYFFLFFFIKS
jgi:hypothetical protein